MLGRLVLAPRPAIGLRIGRRARRRGLAPAEVRQALRRGPLAAHPARAPGEVAYAYSSQPMSDRTLYLIDPSWRGDPRDADLSVVKEWPDSAEKFLVAEELWRLSGHEDVASQLGAIVDRACERDKPVLDTQDIEGVLRLIDGLDAAVRAELVDEDLRVPEGRLAELRARSRWLDLSEARGVDARYGVWEGVGGVWRLRALLSEALSLGLHVAF